MRGELKPSATSSQAEKRLVSAREGILTLRALWEVDRPGAWLGERLTEVWALYLVNDGPKVRVEHEDGSFIGDFISMGAVLDFLEGFYHGERTSAVYSD